jgi:hypothetical protein
MLFKYDIYIELFYIFGICIDFIGSYIDLFDASSAVCCAVEKKRKIVY